MAAMKQERMTWLPHLIGEAAEQGPGLEPVVADLLRDNLAAHPLVELRSGTEVVSVDGTGHVVLRDLDGGTHTTVRAQ